jgi:hypothetical protein
MTSIIDGSEFLTQTNKFISELQKDFPGSQQIIPYLLIIGYLINLINFLMEGELKTKFTYKRITHTKWIILISFYVLSFLFSNSISILYLLNNVSTISFMIIICFLLNFEVAAKKSPEEESTLFTNFTSLFDDLSSIEVSDGEMKGENIFQQITSNIFFAMIIWLSFYLFVHFNDSNITRIFCFAVLFLIMSASYLHSIQKNPKKKNKSE